MTAGDVAAAGDFVWVWVGVDDAAEVRVDRATTGAATGVAGAVVFFFDVGAWGRSDFELAGTGSGLAEAAAAGVVTSSFFSTRTGTGTAAGSGCDGAIVGAIFAKVGFNGNLQLLHAFRYAGGTGPVFVNNAPKLPSYFPPSIAPIIF